MTRRQGDAVAFAQRLGRIAFTRVAGDDRAREGGMARLDAHARAEIAHRGDRQLAAGAGAREGEVVRPYEGRCVRVARLAEVGVQVEWQFVDLAEDLDFPDLGR